MALRYSCERRKTYDEVWHGTDFEIRAYLVPVVAIIVGGAIAIAAMLMKHQERIAKIERGIDPDAPGR